MVGLRVEVVVADPERPRVVAVELPAGSSAQDALRAAKVALPPGGALGRHGRRLLPQAPLQSGDRVEVLWPLVRDPLHARREQASSRRRR